MIWMKRRRVSSSWKSRRLSFRTLFWTTRIEPKKPATKNFYHSVPPIVHVFDREGKKVKTLERKKEFEELEKIVKDLLEKK